MCIYKIAYKCDINGVHLIKKSPLKLIILVGINYILNLHATLFSLKFRNKFCMNKKCENLKNIIKMQTCKQFLIIV